MNQNLVYSILLAGLLPMAAIAQTVTPLAVNPVVLPTPPQAVMPIPAPAKADGKGQGKAAKAAMAKKKGKAPSKGRVGSRAKKVR